MKKIFGIILVVAASAMASCSAPYYPEYVPIVSLGANTSNLICENTESENTLHVISNVEYTATIIQGEEWLSFSDTESLVRVGNGNEAISLSHLANNNGKRVGRIVLAAETRRDTIRIKQHGRFEDFLEIHPTDKAEQFPLNNNTRMEMEAAGGDYSIRLKTSCLDHEISFWTDEPKVITNFKVENGVLSFHVDVNKDKQPRILNVELSYIDGWDDKIVLPFSIRQKFDPLQ